jgi:hypothetical protein
VRVGDRFEHIINDIARTVFNLAVLEKLDGVGLRQHSAILKISLSGLSLFLRSGGRSAWSSKNERMSPCSMYAIVASTMLFISC